MPAQSDHEIWITDEDLPLGPVPHGARHLEILPVGKPKSYGGHVAYLRLAPVPASAKASSGEVRPLVASADGNSFLTDREAPLGTRSLP